MKRSFALFLIFALIWPLAPQADEGMWLLPLLKKQNAKTLRQMGLKLSVDDIYSENAPSLKDAIVIFGNGCTGEVISGQGLVITNHHCGYGAIQQHSTVEHDYLKDGFVAQSYKDEIPTPGLKVVFIVSQTDVTEQVLDGISDQDSEEARKEKIGANIQKVKEQAQKGNKYGVQIETFYEGNQYFLFLTETFNDVRMVFAPPSSIGKFGADTDNWMYPRHTGDFSIFRIYANKNNEPAEYAEDNVPYRPKRFLSVSLAGYKENDFSMVMGFPGSTDRYMTSWEVQQTIEHINKPRSLVRGLKQEQWMKHMEADPAIRIKYSSKYAQSANYWKNAIGQNEALKRLNVVAQKQREENEFAQWCIKNPARQAKYGDALRLIQMNVQKANEPLHQLIFLSEALRSGIELNIMAWELGSLEKALKNDDKDLLKRISDYINSEKGAEMYKDYDVETDKSSAIAMINLFRKEMPKSIWPKFIEQVDSKFRGNVEAYVNELYKNSIFTSVEKVREFLKKPKLRDLKKDMGFQLYEQFMETYKEIIARRREAAEQLAKGRRLYVAGRLEMLDGAPSYPDANFTIRLTYGSVKSYSPKNAVHYDYYTTLDGVMEKEDPESWEFAVDPKLKKLYSAKSYDEFALPDGTLPVDFITTNDITGGNSGSPVLDAYGRLIGLAFDGNWESLSGDIAFENNMQRCVCVDIRYVLFVVKQWGGATRLIDELDLKRPGDVENEA